MDYESFPELTTPHITSMSQIAAALIGVADAQDAAQEALMRAWRGWEDFREGTAVRSWLLTITVNVCRNWQAGHFGTHRRRTEPLDLDAGEAKYAPLASPGPGSIDHTEALDLRHAVTTLPDELRVIVLLRFYAGMDATEIGAALAMPPATVRTRLRRALGCLREVLGPRDQSLSPSPDPLGNDRSA